MRRVLWVFSNPFTVLECRPCSTFFDLHYARLCVAGALREERNRVAMAKGFNRATEEGLAILALAVYRFISRAVKDLAQHRSHEETGCVGRSTYDITVEKGKSDLCSNSVIFVGKGIPRLGDVR